MRTNLSNTNYEADNFFENVDVTNSIFKLVISDS